MGGLAETQHTGWREKIRAGSACADTADQAPCTTRSNRFNSKADLISEGGVINKLCDNSCSILSPLDEQMFGFPLFSRVHEMGKIPQVGGWLLLFLSPFSSVFVHYPLCSWLIAVVFCGSSNDRLR